MREVLKWNKNHLTGELVEKKVLKPDGMVRGKAKIELFRDGQLINETFTENIIPQALDEREWYRALYNSVMYGKSPRMYINNATENYDSETFFNMVLSDNNRDEDVENKFYDGNIIGWCPRKDTNAGNDVKRGVYNPNESYEEYKDGYYHAHYVYDFGTSQGNGTFNSIWWSKQNGRSIIMPKFNGLQFSGIGVDRGYLLNNHPTSFATCFGDWYIKQNPTGGQGNGYYKVINAEAWVNSLEHPVIDKENFYPLNMKNIPFRKCAYGENAIVVSESINTGHDCRVTFSVVSRDRHIIKSHEVDLLNHPVVGKYAMQIPSNSAQYRRLGIYGITEVFSNGDVGVIVRGWNDNSSGSWKYYKKYDSANDILTSTMEYSAYAYGRFNVETGQWSLVPDFDSVACRRVTGVEHLYSEYYPLGEDILGVRIPSDILNIQGFSHSVDYGIFYMVNKHPNRENCWAITTKYMSEYMLGYIYSSPYIGAVVGSSLGEGSDVFMLYFITSSNYAYGRYLQIRHAYSAHTKLPNPVIKTSADTMKIQYDYYIQIPKVWSEDGNLLDYKPKA